MKKFGVIFQYEIMNYLKNKSFMISTIVIAVLAAVILFLPSIFDMSSILELTKMMQIIYHQIIQRLQMLLQSMMRKIYLQKLELLKVYSQMLILHMFHQGMHL